MPEEESSSEKRGGFEAYSKQPVLFPTIDEATLAPTKAIERGKKELKMKKAIQLNCYLY